MEEIFPGKNRFSIYKHYITIFSKIYKFKKYLKSIINIVKKKNLIELFFNQFEKKIINKINR